MASSRLIQKTLQASEKPNSINVIKLDDFDEYPVITDQVGRINFDNLPVIELPATRRYPGKDSIPDDPIFTKKYLLDHDAVLEEKGYFARGDTRSPDEMKGKVVPKCHAPNITPHYDISAHRVDSDCSGFVSLTDKMMIAHVFGQNYESESHQPGYYVYIVEMDRGIWMLNPPYPRESEHSSIGSAPIISYRKCFSSGQPYDQCSSIFIKKGTPAALKEKLITAQLLPSEKLKSTKPMEDKSRASVQIKNVIKQPDLRYFSSQSKKVSPVFLPTSPELPTYSPMLKQVSYEHWIKNEESKQIHENLKIIPKIMIPSEKKYASLSPEIKSWQSLIKDSDEKEHPICLLGPSYSPHVWIDRKADDVKKGMDFSSSIRRPILRKESEDASSLLMPFMFYPSEHTTHSVELFKKLAPDAMPGLAKHSDYLFEQVRKRTGHATIQTDFMKSTHFKEALRGLQVDHGLTSEQTQLLALYTSGHFAEGKEDTRLCISKPDGGLLKSSLSMLETHLKQDLAQKPEKSAVYQLMNKPMDMKITSLALKQSEVSFERIAQTQHDIVAVSGLCSQVASLSGSPMLARKITALASGTSQWLGGIAAFSTGNTLMGVVGIGGAICSFFGGLFGDDDDDDDGVSILSSQICGLHGDMIKGFNQVLSQQIEMARALSRQIASAHQETMTRFDRVDYHLVLVQQQINHTYKALTAQNEHISRQVSQLSQQLSASEIHILQGLQSVHSDLVHCLQIVGDALNKGLLHLDKELQKGFSHLDEGMQLLSREMRAQMAEEMQLNSQYYESLKQEQMKQSIELKKHSMEFAVMQEEKRELDQLHLQEKKRDATERLTRSATRLLSDDFHLKIPDQKEIEELKYCLSNAILPELALSTDSLDAKNILAHFRSEPWNAFDVIHLLRHRANQSLKEYDKPLIHLPTQQKNTVAYLKWANTQKHIPKEEVEFLKKESEKTRELLRFCHAIAAPHGLTKDLHEIGKEVSELGEVLKKQWMFHQKELSNKCQKRLQNALSQYEIVRIRLKKGEAKDIETCLAERMKKNVSIDLLDEKIRVNHDEPIAYFVSPAKEEKSQYALALSRDKMPIILKEILELEALGAGWIHFTYQFDAQKKALTINAAFHVSGFDKIIPLVSRTMPVDQESEIEHAWQSFQWRDPETLQLTDSDKTTLHDLHEKCLLELRLQLNYQLQHDLEVQEIQRCRQKLDASVLMFHAKCKLVFESFYLNKDKTLCNVLQSCLTSEKLKGLLSSYSGSCLHPILGLQQASKWYADLAEHLSRALSDHALYVDNITLTNALLLLDNTLLEWMAHDTRIAYCSDVLKTLPDSAKGSLLWMRGTLYATEEKDLQKALTDFEKAHQCCPHDSAIHLKYADCLMAVNQVESAIQEYSLLIENLSKAEWSSSKNVLQQNKMINLGMLFLSRGDAYLASDHPAAAYGDYQEACLLLKDQPEPWYKRGLSYQLLNKFELAINDYEMALKLDPHHDQSMAQLAICFAKINKPEEAFALFQKLLEKYPTTFYYKVECARFCPLDDKRCLNWIKEISKDPEAGTNDLLLCSELYIKRKDLPAAKLIYLKIKKDDLSTPEQIKRFIDLSLIFKDKTHYALNKHRLLALQSVPISSHDSVQSVKKIIKITS